MKKFIKISTTVLGAALTFLGVISVSSVIIAFFKGVEIYGNMIRAIISVAMVFASGLALLFVKKDCKSVKFLIVLGLSALILILDRFVLVGVMGFGSALFNLIVQGSAAVFEIIISVILIISFIALLLILFLAIMEKQTSKK